MLMELKKSFRSKDFTIVISQTLLAVNKDKHPTGHRARKKLAVAHQNVIDT